MTANVEEDSTPGFPNRNPTAMRTTRQPSTTCHHLKCVFPYFLAEVPATHKHRASSLQSKPSEQKTYGTLLTAHDKGASALDRLPAPHAEQRSTSPSRQPDDVSFDRDHSSPRSCPDRLAYLGHAHWSSLLLCFSRCISFPHQHPSRDSSKSISAFCLDNKISLTQNIPLCYRYALASVSIQLSQ